MKLWIEMSDYEQVMLWWEYNSAVDEDEQVEFDAFNQIMTEADLR